MKVEILTLSVSVTEYFHFQSTYVDYLYIVQSIFCNKYMYSLILGQWSKGVGGWDGGVGGGSKNFN